MDVELDEGQSTRGLQSIQWETVVLEGGGGGGGGGWGGRGQKQLPGDFHCIYQLFVHYFYLTIPSFFLLVFLFVFLLHYIFI